MSKWKKKSRAVANCRYYRCVLKGHMYGRPVYMVSRRRMRPKHISKRLFNRFWKLRQIG